MSIQIGRRGRQQCRLSVNTIQKISLQKTAAGLYVFRKISLREAAGLPRKAAFSEYVPETGRDLDGTVFRPRASLVEQAQAGAACGLRDRPAASCRRPSP